MEIWKPIPGSDYEASSLGRIRSPRGVILKPSNHILGYHLVSVRFYSEPRTKSRTVHSLVCLAFHGPRPTGLDIAHGNCIKTDNRPSNLRYCTRAENILDSVMIGTKWGGASAGAYPWRTLEVGESFDLNPLQRKGATERVRSARIRMGHTYHLAKAANDDGSWTVTRVA